jgi:hypothetical protein
MSKPRSSSGKRDREFRKREREQMKREKAAMKRQRRENNRSAQQSLALDIAPDTEANAPGPDDQSVLSVLLEDSESESDTEAVPESWTEQRIIGNATVRLSGRRRVGF